jgi:hypothetical protein
MGKGVICPGPRLSWGPQHDQNKKLIFVIMINCENTQSSQLIAAKYSNLKAQVFQIKYAYK